MEQELKDDLAFHKFIPFIQLHEFEAMLFADHAELQKWLALYNTLPPDCFTNILQAAPDANPELINEGTETAPSKRILSLCNDYDKVDDELLILKEIGLKTIRAACPHFDECLQYWNIYQALNLLLLLEFMVFTISVVRNSAAVFRHFLMPLL